jgi:uncharacterized membrane protein YcaP (DUF421 family)
MKKEDIRIGDISRILFGEAPAVFALEVLVRTVLVYVALLLALKLFGKRMTGQLTITELAVMVTLGAIVAVPMQIPDRGILQGLLILILAALFLRGLNYLSFRRKKAEEVIQGKVKTLVADGVMNIVTLDMLNISRQQLFTVLRNQQIAHLGKVSRVYLEACGIFSIYIENKPRPGLPIYPPEDYRLVQDAEKATGVRACCSCGTLDSQAQRCRHCGAANFVEALK